MIMDIYSVTPPSTGHGYLPRLTETARTCEDAGWRGILVPQNLHEVDPWLIAGHLASVTDRLVPLVALQPASMPPHTAAALAAAYATMYGRPLYFNLVAGAREDELRATGDLLDHDRRYDRMRAYGRLLRALLHGETVDEDNDWYTYRTFRLEPCPQILTDCKIFVAGSSTAGLATARELADVVVTHPTPYQEWRRDFCTPLREGGYR